MAPSESQASLRRALRTLRAIRQRYATGREAHPAVRFYAVQVALGSVDMLWITAAIEELEKALAEPLDQARPLVVSDVSAAHLAAAKSSPVEKFTVVSQASAPQPPSDHISSTSSAA